MSDFCYYWLLYFTR